MPSKTNGIVLISIPKSGTMFLSRYLEKLTKTPVCFGLEKRTESALLSELSIGWHPDVVEALRPSSPSLQMMAKRFSQMLSRNRFGVANHVHVANNVIGATASAPCIVSDHGLTNFLRFLTQPSASEIQDPQQLISWAEHHGLKLVYLYRDLFAIANSLTHFIASGKSFLIDIHTVSHAARLIVDLYAPVLAQQMRQWESVANDICVLSVSYESLINNPVKVVRTICEYGNLPFEGEHLIESVNDCRSWTFRSSKATWQQTFSAKQQRQLIALYRNEAPIGGLMSDAIYSDYCR